MKARERALPPQFKHQYKFDWFRKLRFRERLMLLMGANLKVKVHFLTTNSAGHVQPVIGAELSQEKNAIEQIKADHQP
jgi:hypothetical protein